jgi:glycosyltransferase involved in cell wall biosynthesis
MSQPLMSKRDIIIVGQQPWDTSIGSNCKNLALEFSKHNRVLYVNTPLDRFNLLKNKADPKVQKRLEIIKSKNASVEVIQPNLWTLYPAKISESVSWIKFGWLFDLFNRINNKRIASDIRTAAEKLGFKDFILFNDNDIYRSFYLKDFLRPKVSIYYSRDYMLAVEYWKRHGERLEPKLIAKSDICVANSTYLSDYCKKYNNKSYFVGQGCDLEIFTKGGWNIPADIKSLTDKPIIGYVGALQTLRLDIQIFEHIAKFRPAYNVVLVGPEDDQFMVSGLHMMKNVFFLGSKHPDELPAYLNVFDVCLNPQILNEVTIGNYPRKIDEYLAMGKPVVATHTKAMEIFADYTYLANNKEEYIGLIDKALAEDSAELREGRKNFAATHTWENNVAEIYKAILTVDGFE